jgi:hypothetical protein
MEKMIAGVQGSFGQELGWSLAPPMPFSLDSYVVELDRLQQLSNGQFGSLIVLTRGRWALIERFLETVVARSRDLLVAAERDVEAWVGSLLPPIEAQVREQRAQLVRRADSAQKIRDAQESLDARIGELDEALASARQTIEALKQALDRVRTASLGAGVQLARDLGEGMGADDVPMISAEELGLLAQ